MGHIHLDVTYTLTFILLAGAQNVLDSKMRLLTVICPQAKITIYAIHSGLLLTSILSTLLAALAAYDGHNNSLRLVQILKPFPEVRYIGR